ncbi:MAG: Pathogenesis-related transcriptional factor and ERF protein [Salinivirgaceae bacterium]|nr:MAG: Pathogenesis-related transcriptional factor and ERF protein [Salinivirgaceae bacterium]
MICKLPLKNAEDQALVDDVVYEHLVNHPYLTKIKFLENLRRHSRGYAFFQKNWKQSDGSYKNETIYLQKVVAEKFIKKPDEERRYWVRFINGNPLDCRIKNLEWSTLSNVVRNTSKTDNQFGYRGVVKNSNKYQAIIYVNRKAINLGSFETPEEAALAYNKKSIELFGVTKSLNKIKNKKKDK